MPKVFNIMQYCKHPITGEVLITEEQIKGVKGNPLATSTLRGSSVAQTNLRYKEVHLNEVYGCAYTPYLGYQKLRTERKT